MSSAEFIKIKDEKDFEDKVLHSKDPVIVSFDAPWCESCKITNSSLEKVVEESDEKIAIAKVSFGKI